MKKAPAEGFRGLWVLEEESNLCPIHLHKLFFASAQDVVPPAHALKGHNGCIQMVLFMSGR